MQVLKLPWEYFRKRGNTELGSLSLPAPLRAHTAPGAFVHNAWDSATARHTVATAKAAAAEASSCLWSPEFAFDAYLHLLLRVFACQAPTNTTTTSNNSNSSSTPPAGTTARGRAVVALLRSFVSRIAVHMPAQPRAVRALDTADQRVCSTHAGLRNIGSLIVTLATAAVQLRCVFGAQAWKGDS